MPALLLRFSFLCACLITSPVLAQSDFWDHEWPNTNFNKSAIDLGEVMSGGPPKDGIPAIDNPTFAKQDAGHEIGAQEPVLAITYQNISRAYPLRILIWHEIVNDQIGDLPITVTYCPLCNSAIIFDRRLNGKILDFGVSGKLRHSDMIMYDRQTESWWQQFLGEAIVGEMVGHTLRQIPSRLMAFQDFQSQHPDGDVLLPPSPALRPYGQNPYTNYDSSQRPFLYRGTYQGPGTALSYVIAVGKKAWLLTDLRNREKIISGNLRLTWQRGMTSALDSSDLSESREIGSIRVEQNIDGTYQDIPHDLTFAFVHQAFHPDGTIFRLN